MEFRDKVGPLLSSLNAKILSHSWILSFLFRARQMKLIKHVPFSGLFRAAYVAYPLLRALPQILQKVAPMELGTKTDNFSGNFVRMLVELAAHVKEHITGAFVPKQLALLLLCFIANKVEKS
jgi:hypothetical protein